MLHFAEFVEALSAPLQFMSQAEKRAKQMQDMGIDEKDISEVPMERKDSQKDKVTENSSASLDKQANSAVTPASAGKTAATPSNSTAAGTTAEKKSQISSKCESVFRVHPLNDLTFLSICFEAYMPTVDIYI